MSDWKNIHNETPEDGQQVLVYESPRIVIRVYNEYYKCWDDEEGDDFVSNLEDHPLWLPLPNFPKTNNQLL